MAASGAGSPSRLVQYVVVRSDLVHKLSWPLGAVITQACHAATAAIHLHYGDPDTQRYLAELDSMHKVVLGRHRRKHPLPQYHDASYASCTAQNRTDLAHVVKTAQEIVGSLLPDLNTAPDEAALSSLSENLTQAGVAHKLWIEQPENIPTCLALKPCPKETVQPLLRKFKLFK